MHMIRYEIIRNYFAYANFSKGNISESIAGGNKKSLQIKLHARDVHNF